MTPDSVHQNLHTKKVQHNFFFGILLGTIVLSVFIFSSFLSSLVIAAMFAVVLYPLFLYLTRLLRGNRGLASFFSVLVGVIVLLGPLSFVGSQIFKQSRELYVETSTNGDAYMEQIDTAVEKIVGRFIPDFSFEAEKYISAITEFASNNLASVFSGTVQTAFFFFIVIFALYFFLKDGERFKEAIIDLSPLPDENDYEIIVRLKNAVNAVIKGFLLIGLIQGAVAGIGFWIFGVPHPALWGGITAIAALIPGVGTALIVAPAIAFLFLTGATGGAIGLTIWGVLAVGLVDNLLGPSLIGHGIKVHPLFVLLSVLGGLAFFGPEGFLLGPLVLSLLYALLDMYKSGLARESAKEH